MTDLVSLDTPALSKWAYRYEKAFGVGVKQTFRRQLRLLLRDVIDWTPPDTYAKGRERVRADFSRASRPVDDDVIRGTLARRYRGKNAPQSFDVGGFQIAGEDVFKFQMQRANDLIQRKDYAGFNALLKGLGGKLASWTAIPFSRETFTRAPRTAAGGIKTQRRFVLDSRQWKRQLDEVIKRVGLRKAAWLPSYLAVGGTGIPNWISRLSVRRGDFSESQAESTNVFVIASNSAAGVARTRPLIRRALTAREGAMRKEHRQIASLIKRGKYTEADFAGRLTA